MVSNVSETGFTVIPVSEINIADHYDITRQKITTMASYLNNKYLFVTTSYGYVIAIETTSRTPIYINKYHKGNITSSCLADGSQYFCTASGSFSQNHDNTLNIYKIAVVADDVFFKKVHSFKNAHGR